MSISSRNRSRIPRAADGGTRFSQALCRQMEALGIDVLDLAERVDCSYELLRRLSKGQSSPRRLLLKEICEILKLDHNKMWNLVIEDRLRAKYGTILEELAGRRPIQSKLELWWPHLTQDQKAALEAQARMLARWNTRTQRSTTK